MGNTNSDHLEELIYRAHDLGLVDELRERVSMIPKTRTETPTLMYERYETCLNEIIRERLFK